MARRKRFLGTRELPANVIKNHEISNKKEVLTIEAKVKTLSPAKSGNSNNSLLQTVDSSMDIVQDFSNSLKKRKIQQNEPQPFMKQTEPKMNPSTDSIKTKVRQSPHIKKEEITDVKKHESRYNCPDCDFKCYYLSILRSHRRKHTALKPFSCTLCHFKTAARSSLNRHAQLMHNNNILCVQCDFKCSTKKQLANHMFVHSGESYYKCAECDYVHKLQVYIKRHMFVHMDTKGFKCEYCSYKAVDAEGLERHIEKRHGHELNNSAQDTVGKENINNDIISDWDMKRPMVCLERCDDRSSDPDNTPLPNMSDLIAELLLEDFIHLSKPDNDQSVNMTSEENMDKTNILDDSQQEDSKYVKVLTLPGDYEIVSSLSPIVNRQNNIPREVTMSCQITFRKKRLVPDNKEHFENSPLKAKVPGSPSKLGVRRCKEHLDSSLNNSSFFCCKCEFTSDNQTTLVSHQLYNHGETEPFKCKLCDYTCSIRKNLTYHMKSHEKPTVLSCSKCTFISKHADVFKKHMEKHDGITQYACDKCGFRSKHRSTLEVHMFIHTGKTKHICKICNYKANGKCTLQRHMKVHMPKKQRHALN